MWNKKIPLELQKQLTGFIRAQIAKNSFKKNIPYSPDPLVLGFENGSLNLSDFNHRKHLYIAWYYLRSLSFSEAIDRYARFLKPLLESAGQAHRFSLEITRAYFARINAAMKYYPTDTFDELVIKEPDILAKISA